MQMIHGLFGAISEHSIIDSSKVASESPEYCIWVFLTFQHFFFCMQLLKNHCCTFTYCEFIGLLSCISGDSNLMIFHTVVIKNIKSEHFNFQMIETFLFKSLFFAFHFQIKNPRHTEWRALFCCWNTDENFQWCNFGDIKYFNLLA